MPRDPGFQKRTLKVLEAFARDGYEPACFHYQGKLGVRAEHKRYRNYETGLPPRVYYVEGTPRQMGYLMGLMAREAVQSMANDFVHGVITSFLRKVPEAFEPVVEWILRWLAKVTMPSVRAHVPASFHEEIAGLIAGCAATASGDPTDPAVGAPVMLNKDDLWCLNAGFDCALSVAYSGRLHRHLSGQEIALRLPVGCNAFSVFGHAAGGGHYFGRDFMFDTGGVFQNVATMVIYNPDSATRARPHVSVTAPGIVGSILAMNNRGVAGGVDMLPAANVDDREVGLNSLLLVRESIQRSASAVDAVDVIQAARRGVPWLYVLSDGENDRACAVEAGCSTTDPEFYREHVDPLIPRRLVPPPEFFQEHSSGPCLDGMMVRWEDYEHPTAALEPYNAQLWNKYCGEKPPPGVFGERGYFAEKPEAYAPCEDFTGPRYYFPPQREQRHDIVLATNHALLPEMRLCAFNRRISRISATQMDDIQWRYDELNAQLHAGLDADGHVDFAAAQRLIDFLSPLRTFYRYHTSDENNLSRRRPQRPVIAGSVSACDLKNKVIRTQFGYYPVDVPEGGLIGPGEAEPEWLQISLPNYV